MNINNVSIHCRCNISISKNLKIRISGLSLSVADSSEHDSLDKYKQSKILYEKIRRPDTKGMNSIPNGTRFMYIEPFRDGIYLPRINHCRGIQLKLFHQRQSNRECYLLCTNCCKTDHTGSRSYFKTYCNVCKLPGHSPGDKQCPHFQTKKRASPTLTQASV